MDLGRNIFRADDLPEYTLPDGPEVFISHRSGDKPIARAVAGSLSSLDVHYWLDEEDRDLQRAAALGLLGQQGVVHAIERGVGHTSALPGLVSSRTAGSWWVPYEIGFSRAAGKSTNFALLADAAGVRLPSFARIAAIYGSVDELVRWAAMLGGRDLHSDLTQTPPARIEELAQHIPLDPPVPDAAALCERALDAIELLANADTQRAFGLAYRIPASHREIAARQPVLEYEPGCPGWRTVRYRTPAQTWLQGLEPDQLSERLQRFFMTRYRHNELRLATKAEYRAEFDRVLRSNSEHLRRALGVLLNPLFGFTPRSRPIFWRILSIQYARYEAIAGPRPDTPFERDITRFAQDYLAPYRA